MDIVNNSKRQRPGFKAENPGKSGGYFWSPPASKQFCKQRDVVILISDQMDIEICHSLVLLRTRCEGRDTLKYGNKWDVRVNIERDLTAGRQVSRREGFTMSYLGHCLYTLLRDSNCIC